MPKYRGRVDCYINPPADTASARSRATGEVFVNIMKHVEAYKADLGIEVIASNYGIGGTGWNFWNEAGATGVNAFACLRFHSASLGKFDCLIYETTGSSIAHDSPIRIDGQTQSNNAYANRNLGIGFAVHPSGSNTAYNNGPWNGTYDQSNMSPGIAAVGNPVWAVASSSAGAAFFPRNNDILGAGSGSRGHLTGITYIDDVPWRFHVILSEDSMTFASDTGIAGASKILHFGSYTARSGSTPVPQSPYFMITNGQDDVSPVYFYGNIYPYSGMSGGPYSEYTEHQYNGGIAHPNLLSGSKFLSFTTLGLDQTTGYNSFIGSGSFEKFPLWTMINEIGDRGILGVAKHIAVGVGMPNYSVSELSSSAAFGRTSLSDVKLLVPWQGDAPHTTATTRTGRTFSFNT